MELPKLPKYFKGEKYIYLLMAVRLCQQDKKDETAYIGYDNNYIGGQNYYRRFTLSTYDNKLILEETKISKHFANFSKCYEIINIDKERPTIKEYWNEDGENCSKTWTH